MTEKLYIALFSLHGLIRGQQIELGRDADTGGQVIYVVELAKALSEHPDVERVDLFTRLIVDKNMDADYAQPSEQIAPNSWIVRIPAGPQRYLHKERLWPYLGEYIDNTLQYFRNLKRTPNIIHGHYADAGLVGSRLSNLLSVPFVFTGHSLGRVKKERLLAKGLDVETIERKYNIAQRIEAEEIALENTKMVVTSTRQEIDEQYKSYCCYHNRNMIVIPPGINLDNYWPPGRFYNRPPIYNELTRFLKDPKKPIVFTLARADERKNHGALIKAFGEHPQLREIANLVLLAGSRDDIETTEPGTRKVLKSILHLIDKYDLYGSVAYPKQHAQEDVPELYRLAVKSRGLFVNPALTEPFGLTLIEAAASGLPIIATNDGGPKEILKNCRNGLLIDPLDSSGIGEAIFGALTDKQQWKQWSQNGIRGANQHYTWSGHVEQYMRNIKRIYGRGRRSPLIKIPRSRLPHVDRILITDLDGTLLGDAEALSALLAKMREGGDKVGFGIATGRRIESAVEVLKKWKVPTPDLYITAVGSEIHYGKDLVLDANWAEHIQYRWEPDKVASALADLSGLRLQPQSEQRQFKISYFLDEENAPSRREVVQLLRRKGLLASVIHSHGEFLDILPVRASKGQAVRYIAARWGLPIDRILVAGDSGNDEEMLRGATLGVVVGNHSPELNILRNKEWIYFAKGENAWGILEGSEHYRFFDEMKHKEAAYD